MTQFQDQALPEGAHIGLFGIKNCLSADRFGVTYCAWNHHLNALVALKEYFPSDFAMRREDRGSVEPKSESDRAVYEFGLERFLEQAEILSQIEHRNVVRVQNVLQVNGTAYLLMDYEDGVPLSRIYDSPMAFTKSEWKFILLSLLDALDKVHERGTVHGDIHPANILITAAGEPVLIDFAAARLAMASRSGTLDRDLCVGYAPAEQFRKGNSPGPATDLYSLGATLYRCITHTEPKSAVDRVRAVRKGDPDPMKPLADSAIKTYSEAFLRTIDWMLCPDAKDRPQSASEVLASMSQELEDTQSTTTQKHGDTEANAIIPSAIAANPRAGLWVGGVFSVAMLSAVGLGYFGDNNQPSERLALNTEEQITPMLTDEDVNEPNVEQLEGDERAAEFAASELDVEDDASAASGNVESEGLNSDHEIAATEKTLLATDQVAVVQPSPTQPSKTESPEETTTSAQSKSIRGSKDLPTQLAKLAGQLSPDSASNPQSDEQHATKKVTGNHTIGWHMAAAEKNIATLRLTTPTGDNAYQHYLDVLTVEPEHVKARQGLQRVVDVYVELIRNAIQEHYLHRAKIYLARAELVLPDTSILKTMRTEITEAEQ